MRELEHATCAIVGIGASAGGLDALRRLLGALPADPPFAIVVVQHLDPSIRSHLAEIIGRGCDLQVVRAKSGDTPTPGTVYVVPEGREPRFVEGRIRLKQRSKTCHEPIDAFFTSLAEHNEANGCGVVLSGNGSDGTLGLREIQGAGGITFAQDPSTAEYPSMPSTAIDSGVCDFIGSPEEIARDLMAHVAHGPLGGARRAGRSTKAEAEREAAALGKILGLVRLDSGIDFSGYKSTTVTRRVSRRAMLKDAETLQAYLQIVEDDPEEVGALAGDLLINVTAFFRDAEVFECLRTRVFPEILKSKSDSDSLRIWVVGCSTGEEVYSVLITALEALEESEAKPAITVFGTDASESAIRKARAGVYPSSACASLSDERLSKYFVRTDSGLEIDRALRDRCVFARQDITKDTPFSRQDLVSLRNVLIYMEQPLQKQVLSVAHFALVPDGMLLLGTSETTDNAQRQFSTFDKRAHVYRRQNVASRLPVDIASAALANIDTLSLSAPALSFDANVLDAHAAANDMALLLYAPPRVVIDADGHILHFFGDTTPFLKHAVGRATLDVAEMAHPGITLELKDAIEAARTTDGRATRDVRFTSGGNRRHVSIEVTPLPSPPGQTQLMVAFREFSAADTALASPVTDEDLARLYESREQRVRGELGALRGRLRSITEEREQVNQSLRSANEEIRSSNEELQSINEELETAKEELQSANEELITVNDELRQSNRDLSTVNDDLTNFASSIDVPVLILDRSLRVRRFTPQAARVVRIENSDIGRLLGHLRMRVDVQDLPGLAAGVIETGEPRQLETRDEDGCWYLLNLRPYQSADGSVDGVVVAFSDVDELKRGTEQLERRARLSEALTAIDVDLASTMEFDEIMGCALGAGTRALHADAGAIEVREVDFWVIRYQYGFSDAEVGLRLSESDAPNTTNAARLGEPVMVANMPPDPKTYRGFVKSHALKSVLAVPLLLRGETMGCLVFYHRDVPRGFTADEIDFGRRLGTSVSLALENSRLLQSEHSAKKRAETLNAINEIIQSAITPDDLLARLVGEVSEVAGADMSLVIEVRGDGFVITHAAGLRHDLIGVPHTAEYFPAFARAAQQRRPVLIDDTWADLGTNKDFVVPYGLRAFQLLPLIVGKNAVAVLALAYSQPCSFTADDVAFSERISTAMSIALGNARLFEAETVARREAKRELETSNLLLEAAEAFAMELDVERVLDKLVESTVGVTGRSGVFIDFLDAGTRTLTIMRSARPALEVGMQFPLDSLAPDLVRSIDERRAYVLDYTDPELPDRYKQNSLKYNVFHLLSIPLAIRDRVLGAILIDEPGDERSFTDREIEVMQGLAREGALAVENARLFEAEIAAQKRAIQELETTTALLDAAAAVAQWTDLADVVHGLAGTLLASASHSRVIVSMWDESSRELVVAGSQGERALAAGGRWAIDTVSEAARAAVLERRTAVWDLDSIPEDERGVAIGELGMHYALYVPLVQRDAVVGILIVDTPGERCEFSEREIDLIESIAAQAAVAMENARLFEAEQTELARTTILREVASAAASTIDAHELSVRALAACRQRLGAKAGNVYVIDPEAGVLVAAGLFGFPAKLLRQLGHMELDEERASARSYLKGEVVTHDSPDLPRGTAERAQAAKATSDRWVSVPIRIRGEVVGSFGLIFTGQRAFHAEEIALYQALADQLGVGLDKARLFQAEVEAQRRANEELETTTTLLEAARATSQWTELGDVVRGLGQMVLKATSRTRAIVDLWHESSRDFEIVASEGEVPLPIGGFWSIDTTSQASRKAILERRTNIVDYDAMPAEERGVAADRFEAHLALFVPLVQRERVVGLLIVDSPGERREFSEREIGLIESIAAQGAQAMENARLFQAERDGRQREEILKEIAGLSSSSLDPKGLAARIVEHLASMMGAREMQIRLLSADGSKLESAGVVDPDGFLQDLGPMDVDAATETAACFRDGKPRIVEDISAVKVAAASKRNARDAKVRAYVLLPLRVGGATIGTFFAGWEEARHFDADELSLIESTVAQFTIGLQNALLFDAEQHSRRRVEALQKLAELSASSLELVDVVDAAAAFIAERLGVDAITFWRLDEERATLSPVTGVGFPLEFFDGFSPGIALDQPFEIARAVVERAPVVRSAGTIDLVPEPVRASYAKFGIPLEALLVLPVRAGSRILGAITLAWSTPKHITDDDVAFFSAVVDEIAVGAENATLFETVRENARLDEALNAIDAGIHSTMDFDEIMKRSLGEALGALQCDAGALEMRETVGWRVRYGLGFESDQIGRLLSDEEAPCAMKATLTRQPFVLRDATCDDAFATGFLKEQGLRSVLAVPLIVRDDVTGCLLFLMRDRIRAFTAAEIDFAVKLAASVSLATENAELFESEQLELARTRLLQAVATAVSSSLSLTEICERALEAVRSLPDAAAASIYVLDESRESLRNMGVFGYPEDMNVWLSELPVDDSSNPGRIAAHDLEMLTHEDSGDPASTRLAHMGIPSARWIALPLRSAGKLVGVIGLIFHGERSFDAQEEAVFCGIADTLAVAMANAQLYESEVAAQQGLEAARAQVANILGSISDGFYALDREWRFTYANAEAGRMIGVSHDKLLGRTLQEVLGDEVFEFQRSVFAPAMHDGQVVEFERYFAQTGIWADIRVFPSAEGVAVYGRDITERKVAEETLREVRERAEMMAALLEESSQPFGVSNLDGRLLVMNSAYQRLTGYTADELVKVSRARKLTPPEYDELEAEQLRQILATGEPIRYEKEYVRKDGTRVPVGLLVHLERDEGGEPRQLFAFVTDLTERKELERLDAAFDEIRMAVGATLQFSEIIREALATGSKAIGADAAAVFTHDERGWWVSESIGMTARAGSGPLRDEQTLVASVVASEGRTLVINSPLTDGRLNAEVVRHLKVKSLLAAPLGIKGAELGVLGFYHREKGRTFTEAQAGFVTRLARVVALAMQNSMLYERERTIADTLQDALLLPPEEILGIETSYLYRPASNTANVGGDFYDVFSIAEDRCVIVVGDVSGKGLTAARLTSLIHDGIRAYSLETSDAGEILTRLNRLVCHLSPPEQFATLFFGILNTQSGLLRYCTAGHPSPIVLDRNNATFLLSTHSPVMGAFARAPFHTFDTVLAPGDRLVLFTDGVTEARRGAEFLGEEGVLKLVGKMTRTPTQRLPDRLLDKVLHFADGQLRDDTVILCVARLDDTKGR